MCVCVSERSSCDDFGEDDNGGRVGSDSSTGTQEFRGAYRNRTRLWSSQGEGNVNSKIIIQEEQ